MASQTTYGWQRASAIGLLTPVIVSALVWSSYSTFHHAESPVVPGGVAWTLVAALDGTVLVTTPVWLSTVLPRAVRNYAAAICMLALGGSMAINFAETGWMGLFPPLIAGALIHLVGVVLRAFAVLETSTDSESDDAPAPGVEHLMPSSDSPPKPPVFNMPLVTYEEMQKPSPKPRTRPVSLEKTAATGIEPFELVSRALNEAHALDKPEPTGPELLALVRAAGHDVNKDYGRTAKARWKKNREQVIVDG